MWTMANLLTTLAEGDAAFWGIRFVDFITVVALIAGPFIAVRAQRRLEVAAEHRQRRRQLFRTLMATRAARMSPMHVESLNLIDTDFGGEEQSAGDKAVIDAWHVYLDSLDWNNSDEATLAAQIQASEEKFIELLFQMSRALGYQFDKPYLRKGIYSPTGHSAQEQRQREAQDRLFRVLGGEQAIVIRPELPYGPQPQPTGSPTPT